MPDLALLEGGQCTTLGASLSGAQGTNVTASGSANTKGAWAQLIAATAHESAWAMATMRTTTAHKFLVDIGIGAAGSEVVVIPNLYLDGVTASGAGHNQMVLPLAIPSGVRVAARCQSDLASAVIAVTMALVAPTAKAGVGCGIVTDYGANTAPTGATSIDPGGTANTKGAWVQMTAATTYPIKWMMLTLGHVNTAITTTCDWLVDIGIGASGQEQVLWSNQHVRGGATSGRPSPDVICFPAQIPAGSRLAVRAQSSSIVAADRVFDCTLHGVA